MSTISGVTKDVTGTPCAAVIDVHRISNGKLVARVVSDETTGAYSATVPDLGPYKVTRHIAPVIAGDPNWDSVVLAMRFNGDNNSTVFTDEKYHAVTSSGGAKIMTAVSLLGGSSGYFDGSNDYLYSLEHSDFDCGTGPFSLRGKFRYSGTSNSYPLLLGCATGWSAGSISIVIDHSFAPNKIALTAYSSSSSGAVIASTSSVTSDTWYDFEIARNGTSLKLFKNGILESSVTISAALKFNFGYGGLRIGGGNWDGGSGFFAGYIQELELYKGVAIHSGTFTPSSAAFLAGPQPGTPTEDAQIHDNITPI